MPGWRATSALAFAAIAAAADGKRVAVVIGNDTYGSRPLKNAVNDARLINQVLQAAGFKTILRENAKKSDMEEAIVEMAEQIGPDDTAFFFYAGHGVQIENENFLIPVDFESATTLVRAKSQFFSMTQVIEYLKRARPKQTILVLDACRSNPVAESQALQAGLAEMQNAGSETFIAFSTSPNRVATDNPSGKNSWFSEALGDFIPQKGMTIEEVFMRAGRRVGDATKGQQTPWRNSNLTAKFFFYTPDGWTAENDPTVLEKWMEDALRREQRGEWQEAIALVNQVLAARRGGMLEEMARKKLPYLMARRDAQGRFDASEFANAGKLYTQALGADAFAPDAALQGALSYLLNDQLEEALALLKSVRARGTTAMVAKANALLKELAAVYPAAAQELRANAGTPPPLEEVLAGFRFGAIDMEAGKRMVQNNPVDLARAAVELAALYPPPAPVVPQTAPDGAAPTVLTTEQAKPSVAPVTIEGLHVEVNLLSDSRDFRFRRTTPEPLQSPANPRASGTKVKISTEPPGADLTVDGDPQQTCKSPCMMTLAPSRQVIHARLQGFVAASREVQVGAAGSEVQIDLEPEYGFVQFDGLPQATTVLVNGKAVSGTSSRLQLPVGKYSIQLVHSGKVLTRGDLDVTAQATIKVPVRMELP